MQETNSLIGEYRHIRVSKTVKLKQINGPYAVVEINDGKEVVIRKEDLFDNYNQVKNERPTVNQIH